MPRTKGSKNKPKVTNDYASQIAEKQESIASLTSEIASITANIDTLKADLKVKKTALKKAEKEVAMLETKKAKADAEAAEEAKKNGLKIIAVSSSAWQEEMPEDHFIRHPNKKNLFDYADICIDDFNLVGDAVVNVPGLDTPIAPVSNIIDFYIAHLLEIETVKQCIDRGITPPVWSSANTPGGDEKNAKYLEKYKPRIKML